MPSPFASAVSGSFVTLKNVAGETVTVRSGGDDASITAVPGESRYELETREGMTVRVRVRDYLASVADYDFGLGAVEPKPGDEFDETIGGVVSTFEVYGPGGQRHWDWWDKGRTVYRIHTREN